VRQREAFQQVPLDRLLVETDAPDQLLPVDKEWMPLRDAGSGQALNHPANLGAVYAAAAELRGMEQEEFAALIAANWRRLFGKG
jgi:TatD DNase family protein